MIKKDSKKSSNATTDDRDTTAGLLEQMQLLHRQLLDENRQLRELLAVRLTPAGHEAQHAPLHHWEEQRRREAARIEAELQAGVARFKVGHPGDPSKLVGASGRQEAVEKYRRYFGILQSEHDFAVHDVADDADTVVDPAAAIAGSAN